MMRRKFNVFLCIFAVIMLFSAPQAAWCGHEAHGGAHWGYEGEMGPQHWGDINPEYKLCKSGMSQSPIDITGAKKSDLPEIKFNYKDSGLKVIDNGHAIQVTYDKGSSITIGGKTYELLQFHFHAPSENTVGGKSYPMEGHLVHKDASGNLAVIGILMTEGKKNEVIQTVWDNISEEVGEENAVSGVSINAMNLIPTGKTYYSFDGSLTTPPCSEGVSWNVYATPIEVSKEQIDAFKEHYMMNARPVQPLNKRDVKVSK